MEAARFHWVDYLILAVVMLGSLATGLFFACSGGKQKTTGEYFQGDRKLSLIPTALSIMVSYISGILILGVPAEIFLYGGMVVLNLPGVAVGAALAAIAFIPLFYPLQLTSINVYLEMRLKSVYPKYMCCVSSVLFSIVYSGCVIYAPATTIAVVTGIPMWLVMLLSSLIVILYTSIGGIKAVIWTDAFQAVCMTGGMLAIAIQGISMAGGLRKTMEYVEEGGRLNLVNFDMDPRVRQTFWTQFATLVFWTFLVYGATQTTLQRYCAMETINRARIVMVLVVIFLCAIKTVTILAGFGMFAFYAKRGCDPISAGFITSPNQLVPYFVMETLNYPGLPGLFVSAMCAGGLSSASSVLNAASANTWVDFLKPRLQRLRPAGSDTEARDTVIVKGLVAVYGVLAIGAAFMVSTVGGTITQLTLSFNGSIMIMGMGSIAFAAIWPWANWKGVTAGGVCGFAFSMWLAMGSYSVKRYAKDMLPLINTNCSSFTGNYTMGVSTVSPEGMTAWNYTTEPGVVDDMDNQSWLQNMYSVNFGWYPSFSFLVICVVGAIVSFITRDKYEEVDRQLLFEGVRCLVRKTPRKIPEKVEPLAEKNRMVDLKEAESQRTTLI